MPLHFSNFRRAAAGGILLALAALATVGCNRGSAEGAQAGGGGPGGGPGGGGRGGQDRIVPVEVALVELGSAARVVTATGTVEPIRTVGVNSQLSGALVRVNVEEGRAVSAGTVLATIDASELQAQLASAEAALEVARRTAERSRLLREQEIITVAEFERDEAALTAARATRDQLRTRLGYATLRAPISGVVLEKRLEAGDLVSPQTRVFTIGDVSTLVVRVPVSEMDITGLRVGSQVDVALDALPGRLITGTIRRIFPAADSVTRLVPVEVALTGTQAREVRPGFLARASFRLSPRTGVLMVPGSAVLEGSAGSSVFVVSDGRAVLRRVQRGTTYQGSVEVVQGLAPGDTIVVAGNTMLRDGATVRVVQRPPLEGSALPVPRGAAAATAAAAAGAANAAGQGVPQGVRP